MTQITTGLPTHVPIKCRKKKARWLFLKFRNNFIFRKKLSKRKVGKNLYLEEAVSLCFFFIFIFIFTVFQLIKFSNYWEVVGIGFGWKLWSPNTWFYFWYYLPESAAFFIFYRRGKYFAHSYFFFNLEQGVTAKVPGIHGYRLRAQLLESGIWAHILALLLSRYVTLGKWLTCFSHSF